MSTTTETTTDTDRDDLIDLARMHIDATAYSRDNIYAHTDDSCRGTVYIVSPDDMADLGARLQRGEPDAYSHWCADTTAREIEAEDVARNIRATTHGDVDFDALRNSAAAGGDIDTVAALDHIRQAVSEAIDEIDAEAAYEAEID